jgi:hypothetical protein
MTAFKRAVGLGRTSQCLQAGRAEPCVCNVYVLCSDCPLTARSIVTMKCSHILTLADTLEREVHWALRLAACPHILHPSKLLVLVIGSRQKRVPGGHLRSRICVEWCAGRAAYKQGVWCPFIRISPVRCTGSVWWPFATSCLVALAALTLLCCQLDITSSSCSWLDSSTGCWATCSGHHCVV